jgi:hypothetical protein
VKLTSEQFSALNAVEHARDCKWFDDQDWNSATFANYLHNYGEYPECTCKAGQSVGRRQIEEIKE